MACIPLRRLFLCEYETTVSNIQAHTVTFVNHWMNYKHLELLSDRTTVKVWNPKKE